MIAKPAGPTSHDVVALVRRLAATKRVGHGGTLDPFASGVLPVFLGHGTRVVEYHLGDRKGYRATVCFGASSSTDDLEGELVPSDGPGADARRPSRRPWPASSARSRSDRPRSARSRSAGDAPTRMARAGETGGPRRARGHDPRADPARVGRHRPGPPDRDPRRRLLRRDLHPGARPGPRRDGSGVPPTSASLVRTASGPFTLDDAIAARRGARRRPPAARRGSCRCSARSMPASRRSRRSP